jgi:ribosomal protein L11 methyltransferase
MPYRIDLRDAEDGAVDRLIELGALDVDLVNERGVAAVMPDNVTPAQVALALGVGGVSVSSAEGRDADSVWVLSPRAVRAGRVLIVPADADAEPGALRLTDSPAFGTGLHPTTALCLEALDEALQNCDAEAILDVGTGSGVLALAALILGVPRAMAIDLDAGALRVADENARINGLSGRLRLERCGPDTPEGAWPLVLANIQAAPLIEMAPALVRRVAHQGRLVLSGIPLSVEQQVGKSYRDLGMHLVDVKPRAGWVAIVLQASW